MKLKNFIFIINAILLIIFFIIAFPWIFMFIGFSLSPNPAKPEITYGEFPFKLEYEINGNKIIVEDTLICEYDGIGMNEGEGKFRKWNGYIAGSKEEGVLILTDDTKKIYCFIGDAEYYMGDEKYPEERPLSPRVYMVKTDNEDTDIFTQDELLQKYNIQLISWRFSEPINNSFYTK